MSHRALLLRSSRRLESLESRQLLAVFTVDSLSDVTDATDGVQTLREAVALSNEAIGSDTIQFSSGLAGIIQLRQSPLTIRDTVTIVGPGSSQLGIDGSLLDPTPNRLNGDGQSAIVMTPRATTPCAELHITGLTFMNVDRTAIDGMWGSVAGVAFQQNRGALKQGLCARAASDDAKWLRVSNSFFYQNIADIGGAINATQLRVDGSVFIQNEGRTGGALAVAGPLEITSSNFLANLSNDDGGAIYASGGTSPSIALIVNSSFIDNKTRGASSGDAASGGAIALRVYDTVHIMGSTISANQIITDFGAAVGSGAAIDYSGNGEVVIEHTTIADNFYSGPLASASRVGGVSVNSFRPIVMRNSILANNDGLQFSGDLDASYSLIGASSSASLPPTGGEPDARGNLVGSLALPIDPQLEPLQDRADYQYVHRLKPTSPARNAGDPQFVSLDDWLRYDQRGPMYRRVLGGQLDMGSIETAFPDEGDLNSDETLDHSDIDALCASIQSHSNVTRFDLDGNGLIDVNDLSYLIHSLFGTSSGDANLDGLFNSADLVQVFSIGEYEDLTNGNSSWGGGDWNCDGDFDTRDLVSAFQEGAYSLASSPPTAQWMSPSSAASVSALFPIEFGIDDRRIKKFKRSLM